MSHEQARTLDRPTSLRGELRPAGHGQTGRTQAAATALIERVASPTDGNPAAPLIDRTFARRVVATLSTYDRDRMLAAGTLLLSRPRTAPPTEEHLPPHLRTSPAQYRGLDPAPLPASPLDITPERITAYRAFRGWSQAQLADALGVCQEAVSGWELDKRWPNLASLRRLYATQEGGCGDD